MKYYYFIGIFLIFLSISSCKKDLCEGKVCFNGGTCSNGTCICPNGFTGEKCENSPDICQNISCFNGGYCSNGLCVCPQGYSGANCSQEVTPTQMRISRIDVIRFPATDNGAGWDLTSGPDILPTLSIGNSTIWSSPNFYENANPSSSFVFIPNPSIAISPTTQYTIRLFDYDTSDPNDFMGGIIFTPYINSGGFPTTVVIDAGGSVAFRLTYSYSW